MDELLVLFTTDNAPEAALIVASGEWIEADPGESMKSFIERVDAHNARKRTNP